MDAKEILTELIAAIDAKWGQETKKKRDAAISPRMQRAIDEARKIIK